MKNTWRVERGMARSGKEKQILYRKLIVLVDPSNDWIRLQTL
jgi:hypothetical protein